jgi:uncharacterized protein
MVHTFKFNDSHFLWDIEGGSLLKVDCAAFLCAKKRYNIPLEKTEEEDYGKISAADKLEAENAFITLEESGILNAKQNVKEFKKEAKFLKALCLHVSNDCNMRCDYCFAESYVAKSAHMSAEVGKRAVDLLIKESGTRKNLEIDFFGGEPLLNLGAVKEIVSYAKEAGRAAGKEFLFTLTTNALNLTDETADYLNKEMDNVVLSLDGREKTNNSCRRSVNGKPVYDILLKNILNFRKKRGDKNYYVRGTITAKNQNDFSKDVFCLADLGLDQLSLEPVVLEDNHPLAIKKEHLNYMFLEYERLALVMLERKKGGKGFNFFHFMIDLKHGPCLNKRLTGCGAGTEYMAVSPSGNLYPCHRFLDNNDYLIGNVKSGITHQSVREKFANLTVLTKPHCQNCHAKYYCGGGCAANSLAFTNTLEGEYFVGCELLKKRLELALAMTDCND